MAPGEHRDEGGTNQEKLEELADGGGDEPEGDDIGQPAAAVLSADLVLVTPAAKRP